MRLFLFRYIFWFLFDCCTVNIFILQKNFKPAVCGRTLSHFEFVWHRDSLGAITAAKDTRSL